MTLAADIDLMRDVYLTKAQREAYERIVALARIPDQTMIELIKVKDGDFVDPYPWRFNVVYDRVRHQFRGLPNKCATAAEALTLAQERLTWMEEGSYDQIYRKLP